TLSYFPPGCAVDITHPFPQATYLPLRLTQHLGGFTDLVALKINGLPYLNPWQLPGNGMDAFRLAKEATLRALDTPVTKRGRTGSVADTKVDDSTSGLPEGVHRGVRVVKVRAQRGRMVDPGGVVRSRL
ncbi:unnamed protein product, partial [Ectocarpus fasciculatus]